MQSGLQLYCLEKRSPRSALWLPHAHVVGCLRVPWGLQCEGTGARREGGLRSEHSGPPFLVLEPELEGFWTTPCALVLTSVLLLVLSGGGEDGKLLTSSVVPQMAVPYMPIGLRSATKSVRLTSVSFAVWLLAPLLRAFLWPCLLASRILVP